MTVPIDSGASVHACDDEGWTAAMGAALHGQESRLRLLFGAGARMDATNRHGESAADIAMANGHGPISSWLRANQLAASERADLAEAVLAGPMPGPRGQARI